MRPVLILLVVGLTPDLLGEHTPQLKRFALRGGTRELKTITPAVTCSVQSTLLTGLTPAGHGAVANGWYFRDLAEVWLWRQSSRLIEGERLWEAAKARDPAVTCAKLFWWYNMYSSADWSVTPRPIYPADGRKISDCYAQPSELRDELIKLLGPFPLFRFWGPLADIVSSRWIAEATKHVMATRNPTLTLSYLPHLDYDLQRFGPDPSHGAVQAALRDVDRLAGDLIEAAEARGARVMIVSEYGITPVTGAIFVNRALRAEGLVAVREELGREILDAGASHAFAVADHQIAHVYVRDWADVARVRALVASLDGVEVVWAEDAKRAQGLDHPRSGELVAVSRADRWFAYHYWLDERRAPDFAATVDIHHKPGYDPMELFFDPHLRWPKLASAWRLGLRKLGQRRLLDVVSPRDTHLVGGSHGRVTDDPRKGPVVMSSAPELMPEGAVAATDFKALALAHVFS